MDINLPENWKDWTVTEFIGEGSYGEVYRAENVSKEVCAIKVIEIPKTKEEEESIRHEYGDEETVKTFYTSLVKDYEREIKLLDSLKNEKNIVRIYDYLKEPNGVGWKMYIRMEFLQSFTEYCDINDITEDRVIDFGIDICNALEQCEKLGIVHRDLKPENILVDENGTLKLCDFGLARTMEASKGSYSIKGTFSYMAPEIYLGKKYSRQVDIYSLGIILFRLLNRGREPFVPVDKKLVYYKDKESALTRRMDGETIPDPADASPGMAAIVKKACAYNTDDRYKHASEMKADLLKLKRGSFRKWLFTYTQKKRFAIIAVVMVMVLSGAGLFVWTEVLNGIHAFPVGKVLYVYGNKPVTAEIVTRYKGKTERLVIRDGIPKIGEECFYEFHKLKSVEIPPSVKTIGEAAFDSCTSLVKIDLPDRGLAKIEANAFSFCEALTEIDLSCHDLKDIEGAAFYNCSSLQSVNMPDGLTKLQASLFQKCDGLENIDLSGSRITVIEENAFGECYSLKEVKLPDTVKTIKNDAFTDCKSLEAIRLGNNIEKLGDRAFLNCSALKEVEGLNHVKSFGGDVFTDTKWEDNNADSSGFLIVNGVLLRYTGSSDSVVIPRTVNIIGNSAFSAADAVESVTVGSNVEMLDDYAFAYSKISEIEFEDPYSIKDIGEDAFFDTPWLQSQLKNNDEIKIGDNSVDISE